MLVAVRRLTGATGAALVVLGLVAFMGVSSLGTAAGAWGALVTLLLVVIGFCLLWEAQVAWPQDGRAYPWRRRLGGLVVGLATLACGIITRVLLQASLPHSWVADTVAMLAGVAVGNAVFGRLRDLMADRLR